MKSNLLNLPGLLDDNLGDIRRVKDKLVRVSEECERHIRRLRHNEADEEEYEKVQRALRKEAKYWNLVVTKGVHPTEDAVQTTLKSLKGDNEVHGVAQTRQILEELADLMRFAEDQCAAVKERYEEFKTVLDEGGLDQSHIEELHNRVLEERKRLLDRYGESRDRILALWKQVKRESASDKVFEPPVSLDQARKAGAWTMVLVIVGERVLESDISIEAATSLVNQAVEKTTAEEAVVYGVLTLVVMSTLLLFREENLPESRAAS